MVGFGHSDKPARREDHTYARHVEWMRALAFDVTVKMLFEATQPAPGSGGHVTLWAGEQQIGEGDMPRTVPIAFSSYAGMDIGRDNGLVVDLDYEGKAPCAFTGTVKDVIFVLEPAHPESETALHEHAAMQAVGQGAAG